MIGIPSKVLNQTVSSNRILPPKDNGFHKYTEDFWIDLYDGFVNINFDF